MIRLLKPGSFTATSARVHMFRMALGRWWRQHARPQLRKSGAWLVAKRSDFLFAIGWGLITWAAFEFNKKAWAGSVGAYFFTLVIIEFASSYYASKRDETRAARSNR